MKPGAILGWAALYTALARLLTYPLIRHLSATVPHDLGDPLLSTSLLWWNAHVLPLTERWWNGFALYPASGFLAYSDHRLGESLIATPLQWLGCSPVTAYNLTLIAMFPLCAIAAHWLAFTLTKQHDASALCGLTIRAAVEDPRMVSIAIAVTPAPSRFIRLRIAEPAPDAWVVSEITVTGVRRPG